MKKLTGHCIFYITYIPNILELYGLGPNSCMYMQIMKSMMLQENPAYDGVMKKQFQYVRNTNEFNYHTHDSIMYKTCCCITINTIKFGVAPVIITQVIQRLSTALLPNIFE